MEDIKKRHLRVELLETVETKNVPADEEHTAGYEVYYGRSVDGEPSMGLKENEVTDYLLTGLADVIGMHIVAAVKHPREAIKEVDRFVLRMREAAIDAMSSRFGILVSDITHNEPLMARKRKVVLSKEDLKNNAIADSLEDVPGWNKELLKAALKSGKTRDA